MTTELNWLQDQDKMISYIRLNQIPCRVVYDSKISMVGLYIQLTSQLDYQKIMETASKMVGYQATLGAIDGKLFIVKSKVSIRELESALRYLLYAGFAVLRELKQATG